MNKGCRRSRRVGTLADCKRLPPEETNATGFEGVGAGGQAGFAPSSRVGVTTNSLLQTIGDSVSIAGGSSLSIGPRETSSIKFAVSKFNGSSVEYHMRKRRFEGYAITNGCMQAFKTVTDMMVGDPSVTSHFLLDQGFTEIA